MAPNAPSAIDATASTITICCHCGTQAPNGPMSILSNNPTAATYMGIDVDRAFMFTFALGGGLAGLGGALAIEVIGLAPYEWFARWQEKGVWQAVTDHLAADADLEWVMLDSTVVRAHACAAGAKKARARRRLAARAAASPANCTVSATASATHWHSA